MKIKRFIPFVILVFLMTTAGFTQHKGNLTYLSPRPGAKYVKPEQKISFRHGEPFSKASLEQSFIEVYGSKSGNISGKFSLSNDSRTLYFTPESPFEYGETVHVKIRKGIKTVSSAVIGPLAYSFSTEPEPGVQLPKNFFEKDFLKNGSNKINGQKHDPAKNGYLRTMREQLANNLELPENYPVHVVTELNAPAEGYVFDNAGDFGNNNPDVGRYLSIVDQYGTPIFYREGNDINDFKPLPGNKLGYYHAIQGVDTTNKYIVMDQRYNHIDTLQMGNGYHVDDHEMVYLEDGSHFLMAYDPQLVGMDTVVEGGDPNATVIGLVIQKLDAGHNVVFQWRSWDHVEITDATVDIDLTEPVIDYIHGNAMDIPTGSNLLVSCRHFDEITNINTNTGEIIWRFGLNAENNMFEFLNDSIGFSHQHDIRKLENGNYTLYDNGNLHFPKFSRGLEYSLDEEAMTAELVWSYPNGPQIFGPFLGSTRRQDNGNTLIGWGGHFPLAMTEVNMAGQLQWELKLGTWVLTYRAIKQPWQTDLFTTNTDTLDFGDYQGAMQDPGEIMLTNNSDEDIEITGTHNHREPFSVDEAQLPLTVPANGTAELTVSFDSQVAEGYLHDVLTINADHFFNDTLRQRVSRQVFLKAHIEDHNAPTVSFTPADGSANVPLDAVVKITFNEPVQHADGEIISRADIPELITFKLNDENGEDVEYEAMVDMWKEVITLFPENNLEPDQQYYLEVAGGAIADNSGNVMGNSALAIFTTTEQTGVDESYSRELVVHPNPGNGVFKLINKTGKQVDFQVMDIHGREISKLTYVDEPTVTINLSDQTDGVYLLKMKMADNGKSVIVKIIKQ